MTGPVPLDHVVLLDDDGRPVGVAPLGGVHGARTPLHLALSCYLFRGDGRVLLTRRALGRRTWPGVWTNSLSGHPRLGETVPEALARHASHELGLAVRDVRTVLPDFRHRAVDASGVVENELCHVLVAFTDDEPAPNPDVVMDLRWVDPEELGRLVVVAPWALSPWAVQQVHAMAALDEDDGAADAADVRARELVG
ncbi:isopentenyl-diphosphate Delta-isomerase [Georgenia sp. SUBG003]|uniref:isopentenyl-diphosphate Delta-isomerase n=1 Tax=Georgenia sp. SUBG003 TaxID=1497974 RepID=UPI00069333B5